MNPIVERQVGREADGDLVFQMLARGVGVAEDDELDAALVALRFAEKAFAENFRAHLRLAGFVGTWAEHDDAARVTPRETRDDDELRDAIANTTPAPLYTQPKAVQDLLEQAIQTSYRKANDGFYAAVDPRSNAQQQTADAKILTDKSVTMVKPDLAAFKKASAPVIEQFKSKIGKDYVEKVLKAVDY